jgi:hypothetical protein
MKVLRSGREAAGEWSAQVECGSADQLSTRGCGALLEIGVQDLVVTYYEGDVREPAYYAAYVTCPECNTRLSVSGVPERVLYWRYRTQKE